MITYTETGLPLRAKLQNTCPGVVISRKCSRCRSSVNSMHEAMELKGSRLRAPQWSCGRGEEPSHSNHAIVTTEGGLSGLVDDGTSTIRGSLQMSGMLLVAQATSELRAFSPARQCGFSRVIPVAIALKLHLAQLDEQGILGSKCRIKKR